MVAWVPRLALRKPLALADLLPLKNYSRSMKSQRPSRLEDRAKSSNRVDWEPIRRAYVTRTGVVSLRKLAAEFGVHPSSVMRQSALEGWRSEREQHQGEVRAKAKARIAGDQVEEVAQEAFEWRKQRAQELRELAAALVARFQEGLTPAEAEAGISAVRGTLSDYLRLTLAEGRLLGFMARTEDAGVESGCVQRWERLLAEVGTEVAPGAGSLVG